MVPHFYPVISHIINAGSKGFSLLFSGDVLSFLEMSHHLAQQHSNKGMLLNPYRLTDIDALHVIVIQDTEDLRTRWCDIQHEVEPKKKILFYIDFHLIKEAPECFRASRYDGSYFISDTSTSCSTPKTKEILYCGMKILRGII